MAAQIDVQILDHPASAMAFGPFPAQCGAEACFLGRTRGETHPAHGPLRHLHYEAHRSMALGVLESLARRAVEQFGCAAVRVHHTIGIVDVGEASVLVQVAAEHRAEAFEACRWLIDQLKVEAPIWKQEHWADGTTWAEGATVEGTT